MENFKNAVYPYWISEWKKLDTEIKKSETLGKFKVWIMKFIKVDERSTMNTWPNRHTIRNKARLDFGQLNEINFQFSFRDAVSPMCDCGSETESTEYFCYVPHFSLSKDIMSLKAFTT